MIRKTFVSFLFLAAMATLVTGIVSYWRGVPDDSLWINGGDERSRVQVAMIDGTLHAVYSAPREIGKGLYEKEFGPFYAKRVGVGQVDAAGAGAPFWAPFAVLMSVPLISFVRGPVRRWGRRRRGRCVQCGYRLTGLSEPRCPECGRPFAPGGAPAA